MVAKINTLFSVITRSLRTGDSHHGAALTTDHFPGRQLDIKTDKKSSSAEVTFWPLSKQHPHHEDYSESSNVSKYELITMIV